MLEVCLLSKTFRHLETRYLRLAELKLNVTLIRYDKVFVTASGISLTLLHLFSGFKIKRVTGNFNLS